MFLSLTDFEDRPYRIPNQEESTDLENFITEAEEAVLIDLLGYELYSEFVADIDTSDPEDRWINLRDGAEYTYDNKLYKYNGIVDMCRPAVYSLWIDPGTYKFSNVGYIRNKPSQEAEVIDPEVFTVSTWNNFVKKAYDCGSHRNTLYGFIKANESDYPTWQLTSPEYRNRLGL